MDSSSLPESGSGDSSLQSYSVPTKQMEHMETISTEFPSQGLSSWVQIPHFDRASDLRSQNFLSSRNPFIGMESMITNGGSELFISPAKRKASTESMPHNPNLQQNKLFAQGEHRPWLQQVSGPNKPMQTHNPVPQLSPATNKKIVEMEAGTKRSLTAKNQSAKINPSAKIVKEANKSVRLIMRESLSAALALVTQQKDEALDAGKDVQEQESSQRARSTLSGTDTVGQVSEERRGNVRFGEISSASQQEDLGETTSKKTLAVADIGEAQISGYAGSEFQPNVFHYDDMSFDDNFFIKDELLQGNGLSWVLDCDKEVVENKEIQSSEKENPEFQVADEGQGEATVQSPETLAFEIEEELFKLFGGVNKKYKEKGRSLLFNLKDRNNPELRERVMYGDISPEQLCSMSVEELASKELSQWRTAKAEELAKMVVLPESDVDIRRLVKKTHKGEVQVEVEDVDNVSVEVSVGENSSTQSEPNNTEKEGSLSRKPNDMKEEHNVSDHRTNLEDKNAPYTLTIQANEGTDLMQRLDDDSFKDTEFLPSIVSLDEFMQSLESEALFENVPMDARKRPVSEKADSGPVSDIKNCDLKPKDPIGKAPIEEKKAKEGTRKSDDENSRVRHTKVKSDDKHGDARSKGNLANLGSVEIQADMKTSDGNNVKSETVPLASAFEIEHFWGGVVQLNTSTMISVVGIFKSGEKTSVKEWPILLEVKGRVRLEAFEKFLQELPMSRTRTLMVLHFDLKEGYPDSDRANLREVAESYTMDERVGLAEPVSGMELYFCPPHKRIIEMLAKILPKEQGEALYNNTIDKGLIGVVIWRRKANLSSPNSLKRHSSIGLRLSSRKQLETKIKAYSITKKTALSDLLKPNSGDHKNDDDADDIPPGFGPDPTRDEDDLPEFNFSGGDTNPTHISTWKSSQVPQVPSFNAPNQTLSRPVEHIRELIHKYGQTQSVASPSRGTSGVPIQPWNDDDDDDIPEWTPQQQDQHQQPMTLRPQQLVNQQHHSAMAFESLEVPNGGPLWQQVTQPNSARFYASRHPGKTLRQYNTRS